MIMQYITFNNNNIQIHLDSNLNVMIQLYLQELNLNIELNVMCNRRNKIQEIQKETRKNFSNIRLCKNKI